MNPTRSANRTDTRRRSATGSPACPAAVPLDARAAAVTGAPAVLEFAVSGDAHSEQNFALGGLAKPQVAQGPAKGVAHSLQNLAPARFSLPQFGQINRCQPQTTLGPERIPGGSARRELLSQDFSSFLVSLLSMSTTSLITTCRRTSETSTDHP